MSGPAVRSTLTPRPPNTPTIKNPTKKQKPPDKSLFQTGLKQSSLAANQPQALAWSFHGVALVAAFAFNA